MYCPVCQSLFSPFCVILKFCIARIQIDIENCLKVSPNIAGNNKINGKIQIYKIHYHKITMQLEDATRGSPRD